jgi:hypothetical protein
MVSVIASLPSFPKAPPFGSQMAQISHSEKVRRELGCVRLPSENLDQIGAVVNDAPAGRI